MTNDDNDHTFIEGRDPGFSPESETLIEKPSVDQQEGFKLAPGQLVDRYQLKVFLGRGGMGEVYEAYHPILRQRFAMKFLAPEIMGMVSSRRRFEREAMVMASLRHPGIVLVDDFGEWQERVWLRMEYVTGLSAAIPDNNSPRAVPGTAGKEEVTVIAKPGRLISISDYLLAFPGGVEETKAVEWLTRILEALDFAHSKGVIHRDMKPANILLTETGETKITDFGLVKLAGDQWLRSRYETVVAQTQLGSMPTAITEKQGSKEAIMGTWEYMSPEQRSGSKVDTRSDLYAVGLIAYRLLTGENLSGLAPPSQLVKGISGNWDGWVEKALRRDPRSRYATAADMIRELPKTSGSFATGAPGPLKDDTPSASSTDTTQPDTSSADATEESAKSSAPKPSPRPQPLRRGRRLVWLAPLALLILAAFAYWMWPHWSGTDPQPDAPWYSLVADMPMAWVPPGTFTMGGETGDGSMYPNEHPPTEVTFHGGFWISVTEVTQDQWLRLMERNPSRHTGSATHPVDSVSWDEAMAYAEILTQSEIDAGHLSARWRYRLPTEMEWEYACRANVAGTPPDIDQSGWHRGNSRGGSQPAASLQPNEWGLFDMLGNLMEWCVNDYTESHPGGRIDGHTYSSTAEAVKVVRGGAWITGTRSLRVSWRDGLTPAERNDFTGFRLVLVSEND